MTGGAGAARPLIRHNDHSPLEPPPLGGWQPSLPVSVVIPAHGGQHRLDLTLAALAAQTYPVHLLEVIVVDDGSEPPLRLPEIAPIDTRIVTADPSGWGIGHAFNTGAAAAEGVLIQRLDADMITCKEHIEALARWHHLTDYAVAIGYKRFLDEPELTPEQVHEGVLGGGLADLFDLDAAVPSSTEQTIARLDGLRASRNPYHVCTGPTLCLHRELFLAVGGIDPAVPRGEDTEFAYRLASSGVVFVPDPAAQAVHLGLPAQRLERDRAVRVVSPYLAHRVPLRRDLRKDQGRQWLVPYVEVVLEIGDAGAEAVRGAVGAALEGSVRDVVVTLVAPWSKLTGERRQVLADPQLDLRLLSEHFAHDVRVRLADEIVPTPAPIPFRYTGPVEVPLAADTLKLMIDTVQQNRDGMLVVTLPGDHTARLERTEALSRALLLATPDAALADLIRPGADRALTDARRTELLDATHGVRHGDPADYWPAPKPAPKPASAPGSNPAPPTGSNPAPKPPPPKAPAPEPPPARPGLLGKLRNAVSFSALKD
ncbi:glycosyltransferase [Streptosporangium soli]|nr:glycosyltransferase [Streptosporangium sp. KLBMP 9127]